MDQAVAGGHHRLNPLQDVIGVGDALADQLVRALDRFMGRLGRIGRFAHASPRQECQPGATLVRGRANPCDIAENTLADVVEPVGEVPERVWVTRDNALRKPRGVHPAGGLPAGR